MIGSRFFAFLIAGVLSTGLLCPLTALADDHKDLRKFVPETKLSDSARPDRLTVK